MKHKVMTSHALWSWSIYTNFPAFLPKTRLAKYHQGATVSALNGQACKISLINSVLSWSCSNLFLFKAWDMGTIQELRLRLSFLQQTIGEIVQQFRRLTLTSDEVSDCLNILDNAKASIFLKKVCCACTVPILALSLIDLQYVEFCRLPC